MLIGAALVAVGVYFGLRSQSTVPTVQAPALEPPRVVEAPATAAPATALVTRSAHPSQSGDVEVAPTQAPPRALSPGELERHTRDAFDAHRPLIRQRCGTLIGSTPVPVRLNAVFGADGKQMMRGFAEERGSARDGLLKCLQDTVPPLVIEPPGENQRVELRLTLP